MSILLIQGDARTIPLMDASVACCVTSPPYFGLRDYGTGQWVGGEAGCEHRQTTVHVSPRSTLRLDGREHAGPYAGEKAVIEGLPYKGTCGRCGAVRVDAQIGLEQTHDCLAWARQEPPCAACWICAMRTVFREVYRVLRNDGTLWINCGDAYSSHAAGRCLAPMHTSGLAGVATQEVAREHKASGPYRNSRLPEKNLLGLPWRLALALQADGWILRSAITWCKAAPMPESVTDRPTRATEMLFLFAKQPQYFYDATAVRVMGGNGWHNSSFTSAYDAAAGHNVWHGPRQEAPGRNLWDYWVLGPEPLGYGHYATFPTELVRKCLLAGAPRAVCSACGKPWVRDTHVSYTPSIKTRGRPGEGSLLMTGAGNRLGGWNSTPAMDKHVTTTGFAPSCPCAAPTRRSIILDPFAGSGTVGLVARELGHDAVCLDLSMPYLRDIARERLGLADLHRWQYGGTSQALTYSDLPLFAEASP